MSQRIGERVALAIEAVRLEGLAKELKSSGKADEAARVRQESTVKTKAAGDEYKTVKFFVTNGGKYLHPVLWNLTVH